MFVNSSEDWSGVTRSVNDYRLQIVTQKPVRVSFARRQGKANWPHLYRVVLGQSLICLHSAFIARMHRLFLSLPSLLASLL